MSGDDGDALVLIVDDVPLNLVLMSALVERIGGLRAVGFEDPDAALEWCARERPVLILLDFAMPWMDGAEFVRRLRRMDGNAIVPVIVVTAHTDRATLLRALEAGANDFVRKPIDELELTARARSLAQLGRASRQLFELAAYDELTGLDTRRRFLSRLDAEIARAARYGPPLGLVLFDVDHFKRINDSEGHAAGDAVLRALGGSVRAMIRDVDFAGRIGGEEFGWALPATDLAAATLAAERLRAAIEHDSAARGRAVTASFGVSALEPGDDAASLIARADRHLYAAKGGGRNRVVASEDDPPAES